MKFAVIGALAAFAIFVPGPSFASSQPPELIEPPVFGTVREVLGAEWPVVTVKANCPVQKQPVANGPCFDGAGYTAQGQRVLALPAAADGDRIAGDYGRDVQLYDVRMDGGTLAVTPVGLETSDVRVPRDCFALKDEGVGYIISVRDGAAVARESQIVVCGGGADTPTGPYTPQGLPLTSGEDGWPPTERRLAEGAHRFLAVPDDACPDAWRPRKSHCAKPAVLHMDANPALKELDLIAAKAPVAAGAVLTGKDVEQWVMKRKSKGYKADSRWFQKSMFTDGDGCWATEAIGWHVGAVADGLDITEKAMSRCGAPMAPVPTAVYAVYGDDHVILNCAWKRYGDNTSGPCASEALAYMIRHRRTSETFVVVDQRVNIDDRLYDGGYIQYDVVRADLNKDSALKFSNALSGWASTANIDAPGCRASETKEGEAQGFVIVRALGVVRARAYRWMDCPVY